MVHIKVKKGLDLPIIGSPTSSLEILKKPKEIAHQFDPYDQTKLRLLVRQGDVVAIGQPLCEDKDLPGRYFVSYGNGKVKEIVRGEKRRLVKLIIELFETEEQIPFLVKKLSDSSYDDVVSQLLVSGLFAFIRKRPFGLLADPRTPPRSIFVKACQTAPFQPQSELYVQGYEQQFALGLKVLQKLTKGKVHLVYKEGSSCKAFTEAQGVEKHTVAGPYPASNQSIHIANIDPIRKIDDIVWTCSCRNVVAIGMFFEQAKIITEQTIALGGSEVIPEMRKLYRGRIGHPVKEIVENKLMKGPYRIIAGDVLTGLKVHLNDFLYHETSLISVIPEGSTRKFLHFFRMGMDSYSASGAYLSSHVDASSRKWDFTTSQHGEERFFIDGTIYDRVQPLPIMTMQLVKALMAEDFEKATLLGLYEVEPEDFALCEFVDPCKIEMMDIVRKGIDTFCKESLA